MITQGYLLGERYKILDTLGEGGMANVYLAEDIILQRKVAVKVLRLDLQRDPQTLHRFRREALATSELSHPNIVSVLDIGTDQGSPYMVMEYVKGPDLHQYLHDHYPLPFDLIIKIMDQILSAVALAHKHNVIHRDLKPENILIDENGKIKIADFGIAVALNQSTITQTNSTMGSVHYMSPEQTRGGMVTKQSDIYSLGIILYELIAGKVPFGGDSPISIALKHTHEPIPSLTKQNPAVPQALENVVLKATAKDPRDRYRSVIDMRSDLDTSLDPKRALEPVFLPQHDPNIEETRVLPVLIKDHAEEMSQANQNDKKAKNKKPASDKRKKGFWRNFYEHKFWFLGSIFSVIVILLILLLALGGRNSTQVPDLTNFTQSQARDSLNAAGLEIGDVSYQHSDKVEKGHIISSLPNKGSTIQRGQTVDLIISSGSGKTEVPDVTGLTYNQAKKKLTKLGFSVSREDSYSDSTKGTVINQSILAGEKVWASETTITLIVSRGKKSKPKSKTVKLRDLVGYSLKSVQDYAQENGLILKTEEQYSDSIDNGLVITQNPEPGSTLSKGDTLTVTVSKGKQSSTNNSEKITKSFTVDYDLNNANNGQGNHVQIYIADDSHQIENIYRDQYIKQDTNFSIPFEISKGTGTLIVVKDGTTIINERINK